MAHGTSHTMRAQCLAHDLHMIAPGHLSIRAGHSLQHWGDCKNLELHLSMQLLLLLLLLLSLLIYNHPWQWWLLQWPSGKESAWKVGDWGIEAWFLWSNCTWHKNWYFSGHPAGLVLLCQCFDWLAGCRYSVTKWNSQYDKQLWYPCGSVHNCLSRSVLIYIHFACCFGIMQPTNTINNPWTWNTLHYCGIVKNCQWDEYQHVPNFPWIWDVLNVTADSFLPLYLKTKCTAGSLKNIKSKKKTKQSCLTTKNSHLFSIMTMKRSSAWY